MFDLLLIRGAPGVGKSTLVTRLREDFKNGITIEIGPFLKMLNSFEDGNSKQYSDTLENIRILSLLYLQLGYKPIIIVGPLKKARVQNHFLTPLQSISSSLIVSLTATNEELDLRIDKRVTGFKDKIVAHKVNSDINNYRFKNEIRIDTTNKTPDEILMQVKASVSKMIKMNYPMTGKSNLPSL